MYKQDKNGKLIKTPAAKRSLFLTLIGVPVMFMATENIVCLILSVLYVISLLLNGIVCLPLIIDIYRKNNKEKP